MANQNSKKGMSSTEIQLSLFHDQLLNWHGNGYVGLETPTPGHSSSPSSRPSVTRTKWDKPSLRGESGSLLLVDEVHSTTKNQSRLMEEHLKASSGVMCIWDSWAQTEHLTPSFQARWTDLMWSKLSSLRVDTLTPKRLKTRSALDSSSSLNSGFQRYLNLLSKPYPCLFVTESYSNSYPNPQQRAGLWRTASHGIGFDKILDSLMLTGKIWLKICESQS